MAKIGLISLYSIHTLNETLQLMHAWFNLLYNYSFRRNKYNPHIYLPICHIPRTAAHA